MCGVLKTSHKNQWEETLSKFFSKWPGRLLLLLRTSAGCHYCWKRLHHNRELVCSAVREGRVCNGCAVSISHNFTRLGGSLWNSEKRLQHSRYRLTSLTSEHTNTSIVLWLFCKLVVSNGGAKQQQSLWSFEEKLWEFFINLYECEVLSTPHLILYYFESVDFFCAHSV